MAETIELVARLRAEVEAPLGAVIVNRVLPELFTADAWSEAREVNARDRFEKVIEGRATTVARVRALDRLRELHLIAHEHNRFGRSCHRHQVSK